MALEYTPTQLAAHIRKVWSPEIGLNATEEQVVVPKFKRLEKIEGELAYRKFGTLSTTQLADGASGAGLSNVGNTEVVVSTTPRTDYVMVIVNLNTIARCAFDPKTPLRKQIENALFEKVDQVGAALAASLTTSIVGSATDDLTDPLILEGRRKLTVAAKSAYKPDGGKYCGIIHPFQLDHLEAIEAFYRADIRGDAENPAVTGFVSKARGGQWYESGNIQIDTVARNMLFIPDLTFGIGFNKEYAAKMEEFELVYKLIGWVDYGVLECWDEYGVLLQTSPVE